MFRQVPVAAQIVDNVLGQDLFEVRLQAEALGEELFDWRSMTSASKPDSFKIVDAVARNP